MCMLNEFCICSMGGDHCSEPKTITMLIKFRDNFVCNCIPVVPVSGFLRSTPPNCRSGATVTCVRWVRFQSIEAWIPWTPKLSSTPNRCCPHPNTAHEMKATWGPWAPSVRLVANTAAFISTVCPAQSFNHRHTKAWMDISCLNPCSCTPIWNGICGEWSIPDWK